MLMTCNQFRPAVTFRNKKKHSQATVYGPTDRHPRGAVFFSSCFFCSGSRPEALPQRPVGFATRDPMETAHYRTCKLAPAAKFTGYRTYLGNFGRSTSVFGSFCAVKSTMATPKSCKLLVESPAGGSGTRFWFLTAGLRSV